MLSYVFWYVFRDVSQYKKHKHIFVWNVKKELISMYVRSYVMVGQNVL